MFLFVLWPWCAGWVVLFDLPGAVLLMLFGSALFTDRLIESTPVRPRSAVDSAAQLLCIALVLAHALAPLWCWLAS